MERQRLTKGGRTRKKILHEAKVLFEANGIENVGVNDIAKAADVSRSTVFNYFGSIKGLLTGLCDVEIEEVKRFCGKCEEEHAPDVRNVFEVLLEDAACYPRLIIQIINTAVLEHGETNPIKDVEALVRERVDGDEKKVVMITGAYYGLINHYYLNGRDFDRDEMRRQMNSMIDDIMAKL